MSMKPREYAASLLDRLIMLDDQVSGAYFEMGQILSAFEHSKLWQILDYTSMTNLVEEEMSFSMGTAAKYLHTYRHFKRLGYNKTEALELIREFSFTRIAEYLSEAKQKVSKRSVANAIKRNLENRRQINFTVNKSQYEMVERMLLNHGADLSETGRWMNSTEAFVDALEELDAKMQKIAA